jgi:TPP-dependent indolepyruvate ferredoxin oxidoreductase alpha subunit
LDSGGLEAAVTGDEWQAKVEGGRGDNAVGHVGNNVAGNILERVGYAGIHGSNE